MKLINIIPRIAPCIFFILMLSFNVFAITENYKLAVATFNGCAFLFTLALLVAVPLKP